MTDTTDSLRLLMPRVDLNGQVPDASDLSAGEAFMRSMRDEPLRDGAHLRAVAAARKVVEEAESMLLESIRAAVEAGDSWTMIGLALRTSKQNAHRKYAAHIGAAAQSAPSVPVADALNQAMMRVVDDLRSFMVLQAPIHVWKEVNMPDNSRHVVPGKDGGWDVVKPGSDRVSSHHNTQADAIDRGRDIIRNAGGGELNIHGRDGRIRAKDTIPHGNDPRGSKG